MSLGIRIAGTLMDGSAGRDHFEAIGEWLSERCAEYLEEPVTAWEPEEEGDDPCGLTAVLHPCAEALTIELGEAIVVSANTTSAGPGYHQFVCELIDELGESFGIEWERGDETDEDETGYFAHRDRARLEQEMLRWLGALAESLTSHEREVESIAVAMSMDHHYDAGKGIVTPLGVRSWEWAEATVKDPRSSRGFFAWWDEGDTARARLNRALARMWASVRWATPRNEEETRVVAMTLHDLDAAWEKDSSMEFPWREWGELAASVGEELGEEKRARAAKARGPKIGYRRAEVRVMLPGGWNVRIPGNFSEAFEDEGGFVAWDETRNVRVSSFSVRCCEDEEHEHEVPSAEEMLEESAEAEMPEALEDLGTWEDGEHRGNARLFKDEDEGVSYWVLMGKVASAGRLALCTVCYESEEDRAWAEATLRSVR